MDTFPGFEQKITLDVPAFKTGVVRTDSPWFEKNKNLFITSSFSKLGIPGARFGFLLTRDSEIATYCEEYVNIISVRYPTAGATIGRIGFYKYFCKRDWQMKLFHRLQDRRNIFTNLAKKHDITIYNQTDYSPYIYTNKNTEWWKTNFNVETRSGHDFNDTNEHSRFNLMISENYWNEFIKRFRSSLKLK